MNSCIGPEKKKKSGIGVSFVLAGRILGSMVLFYFQVSKAKNKLRRRAFVFQFQSSIFQEVRKMSKTTENYFLII